MKQQIKAIQINNLNSAGYETRLESGTLVIDLLYNTSCFSIEKAEVKCTKDMATLNIPVTRLDGLVPMPGGSGYRFIVQYLDTQNNLLSHPSLPQNQEFIIESEELPTLPLTISVPVANGAWSANLVIVRVWSDSINSGCFADYTQSIVSSCEGDNEFCAVSITGVQSTCENNAVTLVVDATLVANGGIEYGLKVGANPLGTPPSSWQLNNVFTGLANNVQYGIWVRATSNSNCYSVYDIIPNVANCVPNLPNCGCGSANFPVVTVLNTTLSRYNINFAACAVNPLVWVVTDENDVVVASGSLIPTSGIVEVDLVDIEVDGTYKMSVSSPNCNGSGQVEFEVIHNTSGGGCATTIQSVGATCNSGAVRLTTTATTTGATGLEYGLITGANPGLTPPLTWQSSNIFDGLSNGTAYQVWVRDLDNTLCQSFFGITPSVSGCGTVTPNCGCATANFTIDSVLNTSGSLYDISYSDACEVDPLAWTVTDSLNNVLASGSIPSPTFIEEVDLVSITQDGVYKMTLSSSACTGVATKNFTVEHNGNAPDPCTVSISNVVATCNSNAVRLTVTASSTLAGSLQYGLVTGPNPGGTLPASWQSSNIFNGLFSGVQYGVWVRHATNTGCYTVYDITPNVPGCEAVLPNCGCGTANFPVESVTHIGGGIYNLVFAACAINPLIWTVTNSVPEVVASGNMVPTSGTVQINLSAITTNGTHKITVFSTNCTGTGQLNFEVTHNGGGGGGGEPPINSNIESTSDYQQTTIKAILDDPNGTWNIVTKLGNDTVLSQSASHGVYVQFSFPTFFNGNDLRGKGLTFVFTKGSVTQTINYFLPELVFREYTPDYANNADDRIIIPRHTKTFANTHKIVDIGENRGMSQEYHVDGGNGGDTSVLPDIDYPIEARVEILKVLMPNGVIWWQVGHNYEIAAIQFWIKVRPNFVPKGLWANSGPIGKPKLFTDSTPFTLPSTKKYNRAFSGVLTGVSNAELDRVSWARQTSDFVDWWYAPQIISIILGMGVTQSEGGLASWPVGPGGRLEQLANIMISDLNAHGKNILITDWEGEETAAYPWLWSNSASAHILWLQNYIANQGKQYYDWFQGTYFVWNDKVYETVSRNGTFSYQQFKPSNGGGYIHTAVDWEALWANLGSVSMPSVLFARIGLGYNNVTKYREESYAKPANKRYHAVPHILFSQMVCNLYSIKLPNAKLLNIEWPAEDQLERKNMRTHRFKPSNSLSGFVRGNDIRYIYSQNLYEDYVLFMCLSRNVRLQHVWSTNDNIDPYSALHYCSYNYTTKCASGPFVYNYEGNDNYTCPPATTYLGMEGQIYEALGGAHETYMTQGYNRICDGVSNQLYLNNSFEYRRKVNGVWGAWNAVAASVGNEHLLAWKNETPYLTIWTNPNYPNECVYFFQDMFGRPFGDCEFRFAFQSTTRTFLAKGNRAKHGLI